MLGQPSAKWFTAWQSSVSVAVNKANRTAISKYVNLPLRPSEKMLKMLIRFTIRTSNQTQI